MNDLYDNLPAHQRHSETSREAAVQIEPKSETLRRIVLDAIRTAGEAGLTDEECQDGLGMLGSTQRPRRVELVNAGLIKDSGKTRKTKSNRNAVVWTANKESHG